MKKRMISMGSRRFYPLLSPDILYRDNLIRFKCETGIILSLFSLWQGLAESPGVYRNAMIAE
jgi:hypothetical protein